MAYEKRGIKVAASGSTVHKFMDDGQVTLGSSVAGFTLGISGSSVFGRTTNNTSDITQVNGVLRVPRYNGALNTDLTILNTLAATPSSYNGYIVYLNSNGLTAGAVVGGVTVTAQAGSAFVLGHRWYFCRNGSWDPDRFF
jgi:hypothetical protein